MKKHFAFLFLAILSFSSFSQTGTQTSDSSLYYYQNYDFNKVVRLLANDTPRATEKSLMLAKAYQQLGQLEDAQYEYQSALKTDSLNIRLLNNAAAFYTITKQYKYSNRLYKKLIELRPRYSFYHKKIGNNYLKSNEILKAIISFQKAVDFNKRDLESSMLLAESLLKIEQLELADSIVNQGLQLFPNNKASLKLALKIAYKRKHYDQLISISDQLFQLKDSSLLTQKLRGIAHYQLKQFTEAEVFLHNVLEVDKKSEVLHYYLGLCYRELKQPKQAEKYLELAIDLGITKNLDNYYLQLAILYEEEGEHEKAIQAYKIAYKKSRDRTLLYHLARNYDVFYKDKSTALDYYTRYLEEEDTINRHYQDYSRYRIQELKVAKHFEIDTLN